MPTKAKPDTPISRWPWIIRPLWRLTGAIVFLNAAAAQAQSGTWNKDASGNWSDTNNWAGGIVANGAGNTADFSTLNITGNRTELGRKMPGHRPKGEPQRTCRSSSGRRLRL